MSDTTWLCKGCLADDREALRDAAVKVTEALWTLKIMENDYEPYAHSNEEREQAPRRLGRALHEYQAIKRRIERGGL